MSLEKQNLIEESLGKVFNEDFFRETLPDAEFQKYMAAKQQLKFHKGETVFEDGDIPKGNGKAF